MSCYVIYHYVMLWYMKYVENRTEQNMLYNMCHVMLYDICSGQNKTDQNMLYNMRHVI